MMLRWLVGEVLRQTAERTVYDAVRRAARAAGRGSAAPELGAAELPRGGVAVLMALNIESGGLVDLLDHCVATRCPALLEHAGRLGDRRVIIADTGPGAAAARRAAEDVIAMHQPGWVISAGFAGSLSESVRRGHLVMASWVANERGGRLNTGLSLDDAAGQPGAGVHAGGLVTVAELVREPSRRRELAERFGALACDMETWGVAEACRRAGTRLLAVRVITDGVGDCLPPEVACLAAQPTMAAQLGAAVGALWRRPATAKLLWRLRDDALKASQRLGRFLAGVIEQLPAGVPPQRLE